MESVDAFLGAAFVADATDAPPAYMDDGGNLWFATNDGIQLAATADEVAHFEGLGADAGQIISSLASALPGVIQGATGGQKAGAPPTPTPTPAPHGGGSSAGGMMDKVTPYLPYAAGAVVLLLVVRHLKKRRG